MNSKEGQILYLGIPDKSNKDVDKVRNHRYQSFTSKSVDGNTTGGDMERKLTLSSL